MICHGQMRNEQIKLEMIDRYDKEKEQFKTILSNVTDQIDQSFVFKDPKQCDQYAEHCLRIQDRLDEINTKIIDFQHREQIFGWEASSFTHVAELEVV